MNSNRMKAKRIPGEHCRFCGDTKTPLVLTPCCKNLICCDTAMLSFRGNGTCQYEHERFSLCHYHFVEEHTGTWQRCKSCKEDFEDDMDDYKDYYENSKPRFLKK